MVELLNQYILSWFVYTSIYIRIYKEYRYLYRHLDQGIVLIVQLHRVSCNLQKMQTNEKLFVGRMFSVQDSLPKLPVPALEQTLQKYLRSVRPVLTDEEYAKTQKVINERVHFYFHIFQKVSTFNLINVQNSSCFWN